MKTYKNLVFVLVTVLAILIQLTNPTQAYADDGAPTQPADSATEVSPPQEPVATEPPSQPVEIATEAAPTELPVATEAPTAEPAPVDNSDPSAVIPVIDEPTVAEVVQQISADTGIVVLDETGEVVPLATQEAAEIIAAGDPIWCPAGKKPGDAECSASFGSLSDLVAGFVPTDNGTIWIQNVPDTGSAVLIDGAGNWYSATNYNLTLQGGWDGTSDSNGVITTTNSTFNVPISITNWTGSVTVNNITIENAAGTGLTVTTSGNVSANNIITDKNTDAGAYIDTSNDVTITNSSFSGNLGIGLAVLNAANVAISSSYFGENKEGANLGNYDSNRVVNVNLDANTFNNNRYDGAGINALGNVTVTNSTFNGNSENSSIYSGLAVHFAKSVTISSSSFDGNGHGAWLRGVGNITIANSHFNDNSNVGLYIYSNGNVKLTDITAENNRNVAENINAGVLVDNTLGTGYVTINATENGKNSFSHNVKDGLVILSHGNITLNNITAEDNLGNGVLLFTSGDATIDGSTFQSPEEFFGLDASAVCGKLIINSSSGEYNSPVRGQHSYTYFDGYFDHSPTVSIDCNPIVIINGVLVSGGIETSGSQIEFTLDCENQSLYNVTLPNDDRVQIFCPVSGKAIIKRLDNTMLPAYLPAGYTYASAFSLDIFQGQGPIPVITEGGSIKASFHVPSLEAGTSYSILYWDNGTWIPLKEFMLDENGNPRSYELSPGDPRVILSGLNFDFSGASPRVEVSTNFPGVFVLAQH